MTSQYYERLQLKRHDAPESIHIIGECTLANRFCWLLYCAGHEVRESPRPVLGCGESHFVCFRGTLDGALRRAALLLPALGPMRAPDPIGRMRVFAGAASLHADSYLAQRAPQETTRAEIHACEARAWAALIAGDPLDDVLQKERARWASHCAYVNAIGTERPDPKTLVGTWSKQNSYWQDAGAFDDVASRVRLWHEEAKREQL